MNCWHHIRLGILLVLKSKFVNSEMFSAGVLAYLEIVYVHYKILIFLRMIRMARNMYACTCQFRV